MTGALQQLDLLEQSVDHSVEIGTGTTEIMPANKHRTGAFFVNDSDAVIYIQFGSDARLNAGIRLNAAGGAFEMNKMNLWKGRISGISTAITKNLCAVEISTRYPMEKL